MLPPDYSSSHRQEVGNYENVVSNSIEKLASCGGQSPTCEDTSKQPLTKGRPNKSRNHSKQSLLTERLIESNYTHKLL